MWGKSKKIPKNERVEFALKNFCGGLNNTQTPGRLGDSESPDMLNISFSEDGTLQKRPGLTIEELLPEIPYDPSDPGTDTLNVYQVKLKDNKVGFVVNQRKRLIYITSKKEVKVLPWDRSNVDVPISGTRYMDKFFFVDGGARLHYFDLEELETNATPRIYWVCNPPKEFTPTPKPATKGVVKMEENTHIPHYINVWYEPCEYELEDGYKGVNFCEFYPRIITTVKDRLYVSGNEYDKNMIYISDILEPHYFPASLPIQLPPTGDVVTAMHKFNNTLIIARKNDVYALFGNTNKQDNSQAYNLVHVNTHTGMPNDFCCDEVQHMLFYMGSDGNCYKMSPSLSSSTQMITQQLNTKLDFKIKPFFKTQEELSEATTSYDSFKNEWYVQVGDTMFVYSYKNMAWTRYNNMECSAFTKTDDTFYFIKKNGRFYKFDKTIYYDYDPKLDIKIPIHAYWRSKDIDFGRPARVKQVRDTYLISETFNHMLSVVNVTMNVDYVDVVKEHQITSEASYWDEAIWDVNKFIGYNMNRSFPMMIGRRGKVFSITISNQGEFKGWFRTMPTMEQIKEMPYGAVFYVGTDVDNLKFYKKGKYNLETANFYVEISPKELFQPFKIHEFVGLYELKGYR